MTDATTETTTGATINDTQPETRPDYLPEQYWDADAGKARIEDLARDATTPREGYVKVPGDDASEDEIAAWRKAQGVPDDPSAYQLDRVELPEGLTMDKARAETFAPVFHQLGLSPSQVKSLVEADAAYQAQQAAEGTKQAESAINDGRKKLDAKWERNGHAPADMETAAVEAWKAWGDSDYAEPLKKSRADRDAALVSFAANAAMAMRAALETMLHEGVHPAVVRQFSDKHGIRIPEAQFVPGSTPAPADRMPGRLTYNMQ